MKIPKQHPALLERLGKRRLRLTNEERRRLAKLGKALGRKVLQQVATLATPDTIVLSSAHSRPCPFSLRLVL